MDIQVQSIYHTMQVQSIYHTSTVHLLYKYSPFTIQVQSIYHLMAGWEKEVRYLTFLVIMLIFFQTGRLGLGGYWVSWEHMGCLDPRCRSLLCFRRKHIAAHIQLWRSLKNTQACLQLAPCWHSRRKHTCSVVVCGHKEAPVVLMRSQTKAQMWGSVSFQWTLILYKVSCLCLCSFWGLMDECWSSGPVYNHGGPFTLQSGPQNSTDVKVFLLETSHPCHMHPPSYSFERLFVEHVLWF